MKDKRCDRKRERKKEKEVEESYIYQYIRNPDTRICTFSLVTFIPRVDCHLTHLFRRARKSVKEQ